MVESFEQKKQWSREQFDQASKQGTDETTPLAITTIIEEFAAVLGGSPQFVPVNSDRYGLFNWCSDGVLEKVKNDGGGIRFGWTIWEWPRVLFTAEFHAVWIAPGGSLVDITPKPQLETRIVFVPDQSYPSDFDFDNRPTNRRFRIPQEPDYGAQAEAALSRMKPSQVAYERKRAEKDGTNLLDRIAAKLPRASFPSMVDELIWVCDALDRKTDALAGTGNLFKPDREYFELEKRKIVLMHAVKSAAKSSTNSAGLKNSEPSLFTAKPHYAQRKTRRG